ncbi:uncharacterized protein LOC143026389 [Oratosquilla oratoria]|uniref:uncharacterized protein LOC143026389 n=1 Tax=Oratosquilla oratoria TaxID=337810 RepID=UPI003F759725
MKTLFSVCTVMFLATVLMAEEDPHGFQHGGDGVHTRQFEEEHNPTLSGMPKEVTANLDVDLSSPADNFIALINIFINMTDIVYRRSNYLSVNVTGELTANGTTKTMHKESVISMCDQANQELGQDWLSLRIIRCIRFQGNGVLNMTFHGILNEPEVNFSSFNATMDSKSPALVQLSHT